MVWELIRKSPLKKQKWKESYLRPSERVAQKPSALVEHCTYYSSIQDDPERQRLRFEIHIKRQSLNDSAFPL
jgi:hypothetical protein